MTLVLQVAIAQQNIAEKIPQLVQIASYRFQTNKWQNHRINNQS